MKWSKNPNYGYAFFSLFIVAFFIILPNIFGYFRFYQIFLGIVAMFFLYRFLKSKCFLEISDDSLIVAYPWIFRKNIFNYSLISSVKVSVKISFSVGQPSGFDESVSPGRGFNVAMEFTSEGKSETINLMDFCSYFQDQVDIIKSLSNKTDLNRTIEYRIPSHVGESLEKYVKKVKRIFREFET